MNKENLFKQSDSAIESNADKIIGIAKDLWCNPETGYREKRSSQVLINALTELGFDVKTGLAVTGFRADLDTGKPGPVVAVMGEYDALIIPSHPEAVNLIPCKASEHIPEWTKAPREEATDLPVKPTKKKTSAKAGVVPTSKNSIMSS